MSLVQWFYVYEPDNSITKNRKRFLSSYFPLSRTFVFFSFIGNAFIQRLPLKAEVLLRADQLQEVLVFLGEEIEDPVAQYGDGNDFT